MFFFRADGNSKIGMGHLSRCMSIASKMSQKENVFFLCADENSLKEVSDRGFMGECLYSIPFSIAEAERIVFLAKKMEAERILVDSYLHTNTYLHKLREHLILSCMDDMAERIYDTDCLVNYNCYADPDKYERLYSEVKGRPELLLGAAYTPLRDEFINVEYKISPLVSNILITTGGGDEENYAFDILKRLQLELSGKNIIYHVVSGAFNPHYNELEAYAISNTDVCVYKNVKNMSELIKKCDIAVSAGGSTCYELCAIGIPFVVFAYAFNQTGIMNAMGKHEAGQNAGFIFNEDSRKEVIENIASKTSMLANDYEKRRTMSEKMSKLVDGEGSMRLADKLMKTRRIV